MYWFFDSAIRPLLDELTEVGTMVEVGAEAGEHTYRLLPYARARGAHLHVIDPAPRFNVERYRSQFAADFTLHVGISHDVLPSLREADVMLLDGDHNWYTVMEELRILDRMGERWPVTFLHDVEWPYGRRDMYYSPERIPAEWRHPYAQSGIVRGSSELSPRGVNAELMNALHEGGPRNGVLTAVEDFIAETSRDLMLFAIPGKGGLGIVVDRGLLRRRRCAKLLWKLHDPRARMKAAARRPTGVPAHR